MRSAFDFAPLFRSTVGFDRIPNLLEMASRADESVLAYPPYNIEKITDDAYRITMAVAGFDIDDLEIETQHNTLVVSGKIPVDTSNHEYLYRGIAGRAFKRTFQLAEYVEVRSAHLENGMLHIELLRKVPEEMKPRRVEISTSGTAQMASKAKKFVESVKKAA